jgi:hypothetical protein
LLTYLSMKLINRLEAKYSRGINGFWFNVH